MTTIDQIEIAIGRTASDAEVSQWGMWIEDALMLITARLVGEGSGQVASLDEIDQPRLDYVVREAVLAHIRRPDDATTVDVSVDDGRVSKTYRSSGGRITIRDEWWNLLAPTGTAGTAFSISLSGGCAAHLPWCSIMLGATYCSCGVDIAGFPLFESAEP